MLSQSNSVTQFECSLRHNRDVFYKCWTPKQIMEEQLVPQPLSQGVVSSRPSLSLVEGGKMRPWERGHVAAVVRS